MAPTASAARPRARAGARLRLAPVEDLAAVLEPRAGALLRTPAWASAAAGWSACALGWYDADGTPLAAVLVLRRHVPGATRFLAYLPVAPVLPGHGPDADGSSWLPAATAVLRREGAFAVRVGPGA